MLSRRRDLVSALAAVGMTSAAATTLNAGSGPASGQGILGVLSVKDSAFNAKGDGLSDDTAACQAAINTAKAAGKSLFWPAGTYLITKSLDCTFADNPSANFIMFGEGKQRSIILGNLSERFPIIDYTGNSRGELRDLQVTSRRATSQASAAFLSAKPALGGSRGNTVTVRDCILSVPQSGNAAAIVGAVFYNTDLSKLINSECYGPGGATMGFGKSAHILSKYQSISSAGDSTLFEITACTFVGESAPALEYTGGSAISISDTYCALVGSGAAGAMIRISSPNAGSGNAFCATGLRTENQSVATGLAGVHWAAKSSQVLIAGQIESDRAGVMFKSDAGIHLSNVEINVSGGSVGDLFYLGGGICRARIAAFTGSNLLGSVADVSPANTHDVEVRGGITQASIYSVLGSTPGLRVTHAAVNYDSMLRFLVPPRAPTVRMRFSASFLQAGVGMTSYRGGNREQLIYTTVVKAAMLQQWDSNLPGGAAVMELLGTTPASNSEGGRLRVQLVQGEHRVDILDTGAKVPAGQGNIRLTVKLLSVGGSNARTYAEFAINSTGAPAGAMFNSFKNVQGSSIDFNGDITLNILATNSGADPWSFSVISGLLT